MTLAEMTHSAFRDLLETVVENSDGARLSRFNLGLERFLRVLEGGRISVPLDPYSPEEAQSQAPGFMGNLYTEAAKRAQALLDEPE